MEKHFSTRYYAAQYDEANDMWDVYANNVRVAVIYDDSETIRFIDKDTSHSIDELNDLCKLINKIGYQYVKLND